MEKSVPVLITCDIDPTPELNLQNKKKALNRAAGLFDQFGIRSTFFVVANLAKDYQIQIEQLMKNGHEIGCHGLEHGLEEGYNRMPEDVQRKYLTTATKKLEDLTGNAIYSFRGPMVKTSHTTLKILEELNYLVDSSVCSQRLDFISSNFINLGWIYAPRLPYQPSYGSAYRRGELNLWVVPVSALILPFISSTLYTFGLGIMKRLFDTLLYESRHTGKPIVYLMHPAEFACYGTMNGKTSYKSIKMRGFSFRRKLKLRIDEQKRLKYTENLLDYIVSYQNVQFMTLSSYVTSIIKDNK